MALDPDEVAMITAALALWLCAPQAPEVPRVDRRDQDRRAYRATAGGLYAHYCAHCHGEVARGRGRLWPSALTPSPPDLTTLPPTRAARLSELIAEGSAARGATAWCPAWSDTLTPDEIARLARWIRRVGGKGPAPTVEEFGSDPGDAAGPPWDLWLLVALGLAGCWWWRPGRSPPLPTGEP